MKSLVLWNYNKKSHIHINVFLEGKRKGGGVEKVVKEIMAENLSHFMRLKPTFEKLNKP